jgi:hypothetical protein
MDGTPECQICGRNNFDKIKGDTQLGPRSALKDA